MILARDKDIALLFQGVSSEARTRKDSKGFPLAGTMRSKKELLERYFEWEPKVPTQKVDHNTHANKLNQAKTKKSKVGNNDEKHSQDISFDELKFDKKIVKPVASGTSFLSAALKVSQATKLELTLYISKTLANDGDAEVVNVSVEQDASVEDVISSGLSAAKHHCFHPASYVLRLHDGDGQPDLDMPPLDKKRKIKKFGEETEYCLSLVKQIPVDDGQTSAVGKNFHKFDTIGVRTLEIFVLKDRYTIRIEKYHTCLADLISTLRKKRIKLPLYIEGISFVISEADRKRVGLTSCSLNLYTKLEDLGDIRTIRLQKKRFADMGNDELEHDRFSNRKSLSAQASNRQIQMARRLSSDTTSQTKKTFIFNPLTAAEYKEWKVKKTNKWGRQQKRLLGLSLTKITNKKEGNWLESQPSRDVKRRERNISDVLKVEVEKDSPCVFSITYKEGNTSVTYETELPEDAAEIVAKIKYIQSLSGNAV